MDVSIIIPCYNHGIYIEEAINSVEELHISTSYEIIIIDDGSTDDHTKNVLLALKKAGYKVIEQANQGLAAARNNAIHEAKGAYILPLDSDNKVHENYLTKAFAILKKNTEVDVVYGNPFFFGDIEGLHVVGEFDITKMLVVNHIDACALFRKDLWVKLGGFDASMPTMGNEDWEFWINAYFNGAKFFFLNDLCFFYRTSNNSMSVTTTRPGFISNRNYIYQKHGVSIVNLLSQERDLLIEERRRLSYIKAHPLKAFIKNFLNMPI